MVRKTDALAQIQAEIEGLTDSPLYEYRVENGYVPVVGEGDVDARVMFIGEAPGEREAQSGRPFVGASGRVLDELLASIGLDRAAVYITNVVKDRPPKNRDPNKAEIALYTPFLVRQIETIRPRVIATLGRFAMEFVLDLLAMPEKGGKISQLHGHPLAATAPFGEITVLPLYHPAVALYSAGQKQTLFDDFVVLKSLVG